jgi:hypothetical protein
MIGLDCPVPASNLPTLGGCQISVQDEERGQVDPECLEAWLAARGSVWIH